MAAVVGADGEADPQVREISYQRAAGSGQREMERGKLKVSYWQLKVHKGTGGCVFG